MDIMKYVIFFIILLFTMLPLVTHGAESLDEAKITGEVRTEDSVPQTDIDMYAGQNKSDLYNHQRIYCVEYWNEYYNKMKKADIEVSSRGNYDEVIVFNCPNCSLEEHYVEPFLNTEVDGLTGYDRIKQCGFTKAVFKGSKGLREIEKAVN